MLSFLTCAVVYSGSVIPFRLYAMLMMVDCVKSELTAMKKGLLDIIPPDLLNGITAEVHMSHTSLI